MQMDFSYRSPSFFQVHRVIFGFFYFASFFVLEFNYQTLLSLRQTRFTGLIVVRIFNSFTGRERDQLLYSSATPTGLAA